MSEKFSWNRSAREQYEEAYRLIRTREKYSDDLIYNEEIRGATEMLISQSIASITDALARSYCADIAQAAWHHFRERDRVTYNYLGVRQEHSHNWTLPEKCKLSHRNARRDLLQRKAESENASNE